MQNDYLSMKDELRQMKSDYEYLKADMDKQTIINRQLLETVFRGKVNVLDSNKRTTIASVSATLLITLLVSYIKGLDMGLAGLVAAFFVLMLIGYILMYRKLGKIEYGTDDILSTMTRLRKFKWNYMIVNTVSWVLLTGLMFFMLPEIYNSFRNPERGIAAIVFMGAAILAGIGIQYYIDRKVLKACDEIINHLKDRS